METVKKPTKRNLVSSKSDSEPSCSYVENLNNHEFSSKKLKLNSLRSSLQDLGSLQVAPSTSDPPSPLLINSQDDLWSAIESNYTFLMADDLITECQETNKELSLSLENFPISDQKGHSCDEQVVDFEKFVQKFNAIHDELHSLVSHKDHSKIKEKTYSDLLTKCQFLKEDGAILTLKNPNFSSDINKKCNILNNKCKLLEEIVYPNRKRERHIFIQNLSSKMKDLRQWLKQVDEKLRKLNFSFDCDTEKMDEVYKEEKALQGEIESRGNEITSIVRQSASVEGATRVEVKRLRQASAHLERSWHNIWIRSLEKQCLTEERIQRRKTSENICQDTSDLDADEGPLNKHRRLTIDHWTAVRIPRMEALHNKTKSTGSSAACPGTSTKDVGVACNAIVPVNDKCVMVGTNGIAALKAKYGDDLPKFEICQDVGYSSESSTHFSSDDGLIGGGRYYNIRIYNYTNDKIPGKCLSLKEELELYESLQSQSLASSVESSSGTPTSLNDSGLGGRDVLRVSASPTSNVVSCEGTGSSVEDSEEKDFSEDAKNDGKVCQPKTHNDTLFAEEFTFDFSGIDSDDQIFPNRSSFTNPSTFYKMISVESDNGELESNKAILDQTVSLDNTFHTTSMVHESTNITTHKSSKNITNGLIVSEEFTLKDFDIENNQVEKLFTRRTSLRRKIQTSTPIHLKRSYDRRYSQNLKRKRGCDSIDLVLQGTNRSSYRVRSWLKRCSAYNCPQLRTRRALFHRDLLDVSSCDASGECTSSSADEDCLQSSASSFLDDEVLHRSRQDSRSMEGSFETVIRTLHSSVSSQMDSTFLLPPPLSSTPVCLQSGKCKDRNLFCAAICPLVSRSCDDIGLLYRTSADNGGDSFEVSKSLTRNNPKHRLCHSLPNLFSHPSDSSSEESSSIRSSIKSHRRAHYRMRNTSVASNNALASSPDLEKRKKRRCRKRSSGSSRSSRMTLNSTSANSIICGSRRRHFSQRSESFDCLDFNLHVDDKIISETKSVDVIHKSLDDSFEPTDIFKDCQDAASLLSQADSDVILTHLDAQSTVSDQVWDGYQEMPYLSEAYSEATVDEDAVRKLTEFGDDYGSAIGQPARFVDVPDSETKKIKNSKSPTKKSKVLFVKRITDFSNDSDSDSADLHHLMEEAEKALYLTRATLTWRESDEFLTSAEYVELIATCGTHLHYLQTVKHQIEVDDRESVFSNNDLKKLQVLIKEWEFLKETAEMSKEKYLKAQKNIEDLFDKMSLISLSSNSAANNITSWEDLENAIEKLQIIMITLQETKSRLLEVNLEVHRFMTQYSNDDQYKNASLKEKVSDLYLKWDDVYEQNKQQLSKLETLNIDFKQFNKDLELLHKNIDEESCDTTCTISTHLKDDLESLNMRVGNLKKNFSCSQTWDDIQTNLDDLKHKIDFISSTSFASSSADHLTSSTDEDDPDAHQDAIPRLKQGPIKKPPKKHRSRVWRIAKIAIPVQLTLVLLFCLACYLEPNCCDRLNNFNFSLTPHLRYMQGPPPV